MNKVATVAETGAVYGSRTWLPLTKADQAPASTQGQADYAGPLPPQKGQLSILTGVDTCSRYAFAKTTISGFTECLIHQHDIPHSIASDQGTPEL